MTSAEKYKAALAEAEKIKESAVQEIRATIDAAIEDLNSFGYSFRLVDEAEAVSTVRRGPGRPASDGTKAPRKQMSEEARLRISAAQKARWNKQSPVSTDGVTATPEQQAEVSSIPDGQMPQATDTKKRGRPRSTAA